MARYIRPGSPALPPRGDEAVPQGRAMLYGEMRHREADLPPGQHGKSRKAKPRATACSSVKSRRSSASTAFSRTSSAATSKPPSGRAALPVKRCCSCSNAASTTSSTGSACRRHGPRRASWCVTVTSWSTARRSISRRFPSRRAMSSRCSAAARRDRPSSMRSKKSKAGAFPSGCRSMPARSPGVSSRCRRARKSICPCRNN